MLDCRLVHQALLVPFPLSCYIAIYGHHHMLVSLVLSTILLFLMILLILYGPFLCATNPMSTPLSYTFKNMSPHTSFFPSNLFNVTMAKNLTTFKTGTSFYNTASCFVFHAPILPLKMAKQNVPFALSTT